MSGNLKKTYDKLCSPSPVVSLTTTHFSLLLLLLLLIQEQNDG
jgi:hypothetical protein